MLNEQEKRQIIIAIEEIEAETIQMVRASFDKLTSWVQQWEDDTAPKAILPNYESIYPLRGGTAIFKGKKPTAVFLGDKRREAHTWKMVFKEILKECDKDRDMHKALISLRGKISGRERALLAEIPAGMRSPIEISPGLYAESHYDTETLLRILTTRILDAVGFDYSKILVAVRNS